MDCLKANIKNLPASRAHSHRAPGARDLIVALHAPIFLDLALGLVLFAYI